MLTTGADWDLRSSQILLDLNWTSLADRRTKQMKTLMFKTINDLLPECTSQYYPEIQFYMTQS